MSRANDQSRTASDEDSDSPRRSHVSEGRVGSDTEADIGDIGGEPSRFAPPPPATELTDGQSKLNGAGSATVPRSKYTLWFKKPDA